MPPTALPDVISDPGHPDNFDTDGGTHGLPAAPATIRVNVEGQPTEAAETAWLGFSRCGAGRNPAPQHLRRVITVYDDYAAARAAGDLYARPRRVFALMSVKTWLGHYNDHVIHPDDRAP